MSYGLERKMINRVARRGCESLKAGDYTNTGEYTPSKTELLLEQICASFGTELLQAYLNPVIGAKLVRQSKPTIAQHPDGKERVLQFQYTRFSPLYASGAVEIYNKNRATRKGKRKREICYASMIREIEKQHEKWNSFEEVTNSRYIDNLNLHRWQKELYFAVYDIGDKEGIEEKLKPFLIHERVHFDEKLPQVHITFSIKPFFEIGGMRENTHDKYDILNIDFPQADAEHRTCVHSALSLHPLNNLRSPENAFKEEHGRFGETIQIHSNVSRELSVGLIAGYLRKFCLDKSFY